MKYLKVFTDFQEIIEPLSHEEAGRLFTAMLSYADSGTMPVLAGNERFVWAMARRIIDQEAEAYQKRTEVNRENGRKGARARWSRERPTSNETGERDAEDSVHSERSTNDNENGQEKKNEKKKENDKDSLKEYVCISKEKAAPKGHIHIPERVKRERPIYCRQTSAKQYPPVGCNSLPGCRAIHIKKPAALQQPILYAIQLWEPP